MKIRGYIAVIVALAVCASATPWQNLNSQNPRSGNGKEDDEPTFVDMKAARMRSVKVADSSVVTFVGNPIFHHNGAVITCDSAVRHTDRIFEWFGNVIINKDSTYIYGDRVYYNGNTAEVFSPLVKVIDGKTVLYTYNFIYDTKTNVGEYFGGGTVSQDQTLLESNKGYYYGDTKDFICVGRAELRDTSYMIRSDSLGYNTDTEIATFFTKSYIWNEKGEILSANEGLYFTAEERYNFWSDAYVMTEERELWADNMDYYGGEKEDAVLKRNIQIRDEEQKVLAFGDYALYFGQSGEAMLTEKPSMVSFDTEQGDSLFMRADSMFLFVVDSMSRYHPSRNREQSRNRGDEEIMSDDIIPINQIGQMSADEAMATLQQKADSITAAREAAAGQIVQPNETAEEEAGVEAAGTSEEITVSKENANTESTSANRIETAQTQAGEAQVRDTTLLPANTAVPDGYAGEELTAGDDETPKPTKAELRKAKKAERVVAKAAKKEEKAAKKEAQTAKKEEKARLRQERKDAKAKRKGHDHDHDHEHGAQAGARQRRTQGAGMDDEFRNAVAESFNDFRDKLAKLEDGVADSLSTQPAAEEEETQRVMVAYNNVKIFRSDFQAICDSMVAFTIDSTIHMYSDPLMWNGDNQIQSDEATIFTKDEALDRALFTGSQNRNPVMSARLDSRHFNQVTGKTIEAFFEDNNMYRTDAVGNGITYYFMQDDNSRALQGFLVVESADITFYIAEQMVDSIAFRGNPVYAIYPMDQIPATQAQALPQFKWEGHRKPTQKEVFDRSIRPSRREEYTSMPQPAFPLTDKIDNYRNKLIHSGFWSDRTDDISSEARQFMESIRLRDQQEKAAQGRK